MKENALITVRDLSFDVDRKVLLNNVSAEFWKGHIHALVGPNGAGKSTFSSVLMGLSGYRDITGSILFEGNEISNMSINERAQKGITLAWQEPARFEGVTVREYLASGCRDNKCSLNSMKQTLSLVGLSADKYINRAVDRTLSGGERKKIELASILIMEPAFVMLDEPDSGIDVASLDKIFEAVKILKTKGTTVLLITHSLTVLKQAEHAFLMCCGKIIEKGVTEKIIPYFEGRCIPCDHQNKPEYERE